MPLYSFIFSKVANQKYFLFFLFFVLAFSSFCGIDNLSCPFVVIINLVNPIIISIKVINMIIIHLCMLSVTFRMKIVSVVLAQSLNII